MNIERALKNIGDWISKETESRKYPKSELLELSESLQALKAVSNQYLHDVILTALRQMKPSGWIPVSERLPEEKDASANNKILVLFDNGFVDIWNYLLFVYHVTSNAEFDLAQITHWMPLPQPPESEARA